MYFTSRRGLRRLNPRFDGHLLLLPDRKNPLKMTSPVAFSQKSRDRNITSEQERRSRNKTRARTICRTNSFECYEECLAFGVGIAFLTFAMLRVSFPASTAYRIKAPLVDQRQTPTLVRSIGRFLFLSSGCELAFPSLSRYST